ncbi:MAG TPA: creatininase family protein [Lichenihabitans sp.]|jgi:creatinine amidohydrolase/Fe(II)-dependent formamide hydrolase-like protein|nr:creatininase family protein [Lichenihabitans sp.]
MSRIAALLVLVLCVSTPSWAQAPDTVFLEDLTWTELHDLIQAGKTTVIIPVGGVEQSGPDMALGKHDVRAKFLSEKIARNLGNALVAPVIAYVPEGGIDPPTSHMRFPGTLTVPSDVFRKVVQSAATSLKLHGFKDVVLIGDHGGYQGDLRAVADQLNRSWAATPARAHYVPEYYRAAASDFFSVLKSRGYSTGEIGTHAGLADTSLMLAVDPRLVRADGLRSGTHLDAAHGVYGDPRRSSAELGQLAVDEIVKKTTEVIRADVKKSGPGR